MGSSGSRSEWGGFSPQLQNYTLAHTYSPLSIYRHLYSGEEIMEFKQPIANRTDMDRHLHTFTARYQHIYLVATLYAHLSGSMGCGGEGEVSIYYERAVTNLSRVNDIPFSDSLHCLGVALKGFELLFKSYGYFEVYEDMFHICQRGRLKVWCNRHIYKNVPEQYLLGGGTEQDMVARVLNIVQQNTENKGHFPITQTLLALPKLTFTNALAAFRQICREQHLFVPEHLESLRNSLHIQRMLDIYQPPVKPIPLMYPQQHPSPTTDMARSASSRHQNRLLPSERGRSLDASERKTFEQASQQQQFPQFIVKRNRNHQELPRSRSLPQITRNTPPSNSRLVVQNAVQSTHSHLHPAQPNLQQFRKDKQPESKLRKRNFAVNQSQPVIRFANHQQTQNIHQLNQTRLIGKSIHQEPAAQQPPQYIVQPNYQPVQISQNSQVRQIQFNQQPNQLDQQGIPRLPSRPVSHHESNPNQHHPLPQSRPQTPVNKINQQHQPQQIPTLNHQLYQQQQPHHPQPLPINTYHRPMQIIPNRGTSLPIRVTYAESPKKHSSRRQPKQNSINRTKDQVRLVTLGEGSGKKTAEFVAPTEQKEDKFTFSQLESKIQLLESFTDNRITTQQFLPNQSHALSNIKWERGSNSGRDSVSSAFRKDILDPSTKMPSNRLSNEPREQSVRNSNPVSRFDYSQYETDPKLLQLIRSAHSKYAPNLSKTGSIEDRLRKYEQEYSRKDKIKEIAAYSIPKKKDNEPTKSYFSKTTNLTSWSSQEGPSLRKKAEPYLNKVSAISEKWEEQNICSTSQGSRGQGLASNLDQDILQDMAQFGLEVGRRAR